MSKRTKITNYFFPAKKFKQYDDFMAIDNNDNDNKNNYNDDEKKDNYYDNSNCNNLDVDINNNVDKINNVDNKKLLETNQEIFKNNQAKARNFARARYAQIKKENEKILAKTKTMHEKQPNGEINL